MSTLGELSEEQVEAILCSDVYDINDDPDTPKLTRAINAALAAALVAEGQEAQPKTPYSLHCAQIRRKAIEETLEIYIKAFEQDWVVQDCIDAIKRLAAAAPSLHKEGLPAPDDRNIWSEVRRLTEIRLRSTTTQEPLSAFSADDVRFLLYLIGQRERAFKELTRMTAERAALHKEGAGSDELCECGQPENSIRHSFTAASSVDAHAFKPSKLRYCGRCNQRRYFVDGKCEMCAASPAGRAEQATKEER